MGSAQVRMRKELNMAVCWILYGESERLCFGGKPKHIMSNTRIKRPAVAGDRVYVDDGCGGSFEAIVVRVEAGFATVACTNVEAEYPLKNCRVVKKPQSAGEYRAECLRAHGFEKAEQY